MLKDGIRLFHLNNILYRPGSIAAESIPSGSKNCRLWRIYGMLRGHDLQVEK